MLSVVALSSVLVSHEKGVENFIREAYAEMETSFPMKGRGVESAVY